MSISNLFNPNNTDLFCDVLTCNTLNTNNLNVSGIQFPKSALFIPIIAAFPGSFLNVSSVTENKATWTRIGNIVTINLEFTCPGSTSVPTSNNFGCEIRGLPYTIALVVNPKPITGICSVGPQSVALPTPAGSFFGLGYVDVVGTTDVHLNIVVFNNPGISTLANHTVTACFSYQTPDPF